MDTKKSYKNSLFGEINGKIYENDFFAEINAEKIYENSMYSKKDQWKLLLVDEIFRASFCRTNLCQFLFVFAVVPCFVLNLRSAFIWPLLNNQLYSLNFECLLTMKESNGWIMFSLDFVHVSVIL